MQTLLPLRNNTVVETLSIDKTKKLKGTIDSQRFVSDITYYNLSDIFVFDTEKNSWVKDEYDYGILRLPEELTSKP